jgi:D-3-phosphoglycerate dehydrogenase
VLKASLILDFDSTFISLESLVELAEIVLRDAPDREQRVARIDGLTNAGMEGRISFGESLTRRVETLRPTQAHLDELVKALKGKVTPSVAAHRDWIAGQAERIYVISGGFKEFVMPVMSDYGIAPEHVLANTFEWGSDGRVSGVKSHPLARDGGKVAVLRELALQQPVVMVGDALGDFETRQHGVADHFVAFTENIDRPGVAEKADAVANNFHQIVSFVHGSEIASAVESIS